MSIDILGTETRIERFVHQIFIEGSAAQVALDEVAPQIGAKNGRNVLKTAPDSHLIGDFGQSL